MALTPSASVVVATHNRRSRLPVLLDALSREPVDEIIIVVNGSDDGSEQLVAARALDDVRIKAISMEVADQWTALQRGVEEASTDVVLLLDDDVLPATGLARGHAQHHASQPNLLVVGYMPVFRSQPQHAGEFATDLYSAAYEHTCAEYEEDPVTILHGLWGGNVSIRREVALEVGLANDRSPNRTWRHDDREFGLRCAESGVKAIFARDLRAVHHHRVGIDEFLRNCRDSGHGRWCLHRDWGATLGPLPDDFFLRDIPRPQRTIVRLARRPAARRLIQAILRAATKVAGLLHLFRLESHIGWLMGMIEQQRGALDAGASTRAQDTPPL